MAGVALALAACSSSAGRAAETTTTSASTTTTTTTTSTSTTTTAPPTTTAAVSTTTGFGALAADWERTHQPDSDFASGAAYDQDPSLPPINGHTGARYVTVSRSGDRVTSYQINFVSGTSEADATTASLAELPADAVMVGFRALPADGQGNGACALLTMSSATLGAVLPSNPDGGVVAELTSGSAGDTYDPSDVGSAYLFGISLDATADLRC
jgi:hypothetical protein